MLVFVPSRQMNKVNLTGRIVVHSNPAIFVAIIFIVIGIFYKQNNDREDAKETTHKKPQP